ncbi:hypothetical protein ABZT17_34020, partial [Streptomyces sp. NPDC005648]
VGRRPSGSPPPAVRPALGTPYPPAPSAPPAGMPGAGIPAPGMGEAAPGRDETDPEQPHHRA